MTRLLDEVDRTILREVAANGRQTIRALAKIVGPSEPSARERLQRLERDGVIDGYHASLDPAKVDAGTAAFVALRFDPGAAAKAIVDERLRAESCVLEAHEVAGEDCYWLKVRVSTTDALADVLDRIREIPSVRSTNTTIVLRTVIERPLAVGPGLIAAVAPDGASPGETGEGGKQQRRPRPDGDDAYRNPESTTSAVHLDV